MNTTEGNPSGITWTSEKQWGSIGLTYHARLKRGSDVWSLTIDQPNKGFWVLRGWNKGQFSLYRGGTTLAGLKDLADDILTKGRA